MATATSAGITNCASCGGKLSYNFKTNRNKCEYCGNEYEAVVEEVKSGDQKIPLSYTL
ncbi:hypothetical protein [Mucilaginibacter pedocola]|uniref:hypothetical protein n=1 Tax=Mucilaginibacter pedocola TaxID=1792845 RepID=UPI0012DE78A0|nr:hypothetical protein [Mucilaginibacter pedocola]